mgnify:CR=1 FL=1
MYQLFCLCKKYKNKKPYLIYPKDETEGQKQPKNIYYLYEQGLNLSVVSFDIIEDFKKRDFF